MRAHQFATLPVTPGAITLFGDSITEGGLWSEWFPGIAIHNRGISGERVADLQARTASAVPRSTAVFLLIGTNDLSFGAGPTQIAAEIRTLLVDIRKVAPDARIYVQSVMPRQVEFASELLELNGRLRLLADDLGAQYLDLWPALAGQDLELRSDYTLDGLHLNGDGYAAWVEVLRPHIIAIARSAQG